MKQSVCVRKLSSTKCQPRSPYVIYISETNFMWRQVSGTVCYLLENGIVHYWNELYLSIKDKNVFETFEVVMWIIGDVLIEFPLKLKLSQPPSETIKWASKKTSNWSYLVCFIKENCIKYCTPFPLILNPS